MRHLLSVALFAGLCSGAEAATIYQNGFETGDLTGITGSGITTAPNGQKFLGVLSVGNSATLTLTGLSGYANLALSFDLLALNSLDGQGLHCCGPDVFKLVVNGTTLMQDSFAQNAGWVQTYGNGGSGTVAGGTGADAFGVYGYEIGYGPDQTYNLSFTGLGSNISSLTIDFFGNSDQAWGDEGFGIDNIVVTGDLSQVPLPAGLPLLAGALGGLALLRRRRA